MSTLGELFDLPSSDALSTGVKRLVSKHLPAGWREWRTISPLGQSDAKLDHGRLRFVLPTVELVKLFLPGATHVSDRQFKEMKAALCKLPFCLPLITSPSTYAKSLRPSDEDYALFVKSVAPLLKLSLSLADLNRCLALAQEVVRVEDTTEEVVAQTTVPLAEQPPPDPLVQRLSILEERLQSFSSLETKLEALSQHLLRTSHVPPPGPALPGPAPGCPNPHYVDPSEEDYYSDSSAPSAGSPSEYDEEAGRTLDVWAPEPIPTEPPATAPPSFSFEPSTQQLEPDLPEPSPRLRELLASCQLWGQEGWIRIPYKEAEDRLRHSGGFQPLSVNLELRHHPEDFHLRQQERVLANIQFGVLAQREAFSQAAQAFLLACPEATSKFVEAFTSEQAQFRLASQDLVQYVCGKRSELIVKRRDLCTPSDQRSKYLLRNIPPSESHLFAEQELSKCSLPSSSSTSYAARPKRRAPPASSGQPRAKIPKPSDQRARRQEPRTFQAPRGSLSKWKDARREGARAQDKRSKPSFRGRNQPRRQ
uniref:Uncharacterized protein n=1 Tax=Cacopsylla melanoneura TaxID=428564 RepID=A0A8D8YX02_9HEMI